jgi:hypothetical protein
MARNDEEEKILALELEASQIAYRSGIIERSYRVGETELGEQFRWIAGQYLAEMSDKTPAERKRLRQEMSRLIKELGDAVRAKHIEHRVPFSCIDDYDECVRKRKRQKKSPYLCFLALYICLANSMKVLLALLPQPLPKPEVS